MLLDCKCNVLQQADGSSTCVFGRYYVLDIVLCNNTLGNSSVMVAVYGPCGVRTNKELHDRAALDVTVQYAIGRQDNCAVLIKRIVTCACEKAIKLDEYPHTAISIALFIKKEDQNLLSCTLTSCCVALLDSGLSMNSTFGAVMIDSSTLINKVC